MKKILLAVGLTLASMSGSASTNNSNDVVVVGNGTGSVQVSQCASAWTCNNSSLNVSFEGDVDKVYVDGKATVIKGKDGVNGTNGIDGKDGRDGIDGKDGAQGIQGEKGDKGDTGATGAAGKDGINGTNGKDGLNGLDGKDGKDGLNGTNGVDGKNGLDGKDGKDGRDGVDGKDGATGAKGDKGDTGAAGKDGVNGIDGINGINGIDGTNGTDGKDADMSVVNDNKAAIAAQQQELRNVNKQFSSLKEKVDDNHKKANAGIAGVAAMANIPQVTESARFSLGAGVGFRGDEQAIAVGMSSRLSQSVIGKMSVAADTQSDFTVGAGVAVQW
ncbi:hypothetical protein H0088_004105 [Salmonella enterica]|nr:hypothetical protein [Salmonella enterica]